MHKIQFIQKSINLLKNSSKLSDQFLNKINSTNKCRKKRSESLLAMSKICIAMLEFLELKTFKIGTYNSDQFIPLCDYDYIATTCRFKLQRVKRAIKSLKNAGYLRVTKSYVRLRDGSYKSFTAIKKFASAFFTDIGLDQHEIDKAKNWKSEKLKNNKSTKISESEGINNLEIISNKIYSLGKKLFSKVVIKQSVNIDAEKKRQLILEAEEVSKKTGLSYVDAYRRLESLLT